MSLKPTLDAILEKWTKNGDLPMIAAGVVTKEGIIYQGATGVNNVMIPESKTNLDTQFELFSNSKAITTTAAVQLIEQGLLGIDDLAEDYFPELKGLQVIEGFDENDKPILKDPIKKPTIRNLLTHTSGFAFSFFNFKYKKLLDTTGKPNLFEDSWEHLIAPYAYEPGTQWHYGAGVDVVGKIIEIITGLSLEEYIQKNILEPLEITTISFNRREENRTALHLRTAEGTVIPLPDLRPAKPNFCWGGHGLYGTIPDFLKFILIFLNKGTSPINGKQILKPESVEKYSFANLFPEEVVFKNTLEPAEPLYSTKVTLFDNVPKGKNSWTASFYRTDVELPTGRSPISFSWCGISNSFYWIDPTEGVAGFFATQILPFCDEISLKANNEFETEIYKYLRS